MELFLSNSRGLGIGALALLAGVVVVLTIVYIVMSIEHRREMNRKLDDVERQRLEKQGLIAKNSKFNREEDLEVLVCDLRIIEKRLVKVASNPDVRHRNLIRVTIKRIKTTQALVYDLSRYFNDYKYSIRVSTDEAKKVTCQLTREAIKTYRELEDLLSGAASFGKDSDIMGELDAYIYKEVSNLLEKVEKINHNLRQ